MNYLRVYCNLIRKAENRTSPEGYTEKHHTFPKSIFGKNNRIVVLTGREHYIAHVLLEKIFIKRYGLKDQKTIKMIYAHISMKASRDILKNKKYFNSYLYEYARMRFSKIMKERKIPEHIKVKMGLYKKGKESRRYGKKHSNELKNKWKIKRGRDFSVLNPYGKIIKGKNITNFCRENNLNPSSLNSVINGKRSEHKGWRNIKDYGKSNYELKTGNEFTIINPDGEIIIEKNIKQFCKKHNLHTGHFCAVLKGKNKSHKGYHIASTQKT
jgi:uncharacterized protein (DUF2147 family)